MGPLSRLLLIGSTAGVLGFTQASFAQTPPPATPTAPPEKLAPFEKAVLDTETAWTKLASTLETRLARLLPCDANVARLIDETQKASEARLGALARYYKALQVNAAAATDSIRAVMDDQRTRAAADAQERADTEQERSAVESRLVNIEASVQQKAALGAVRTQLQQIEALIRDRAILVSSQSTNRTEAMGLLQDILTASQNRELALSKEAGALSDEQTAWNGYYGARTARSRTECQALGGPAVAPAKPAKPGTDKGK